MRSAVCRSSVTAFVIPLVTSRVVADFVAETTVVPDISAASVFVPPTSIPIIIAFLRSRRFDLPRLEQVGSDAQDRPCGCQGDENEIVDAMATTPLRCLIP